MKRIYADSHPPLLNPRDIDFLLYEWLDVGALCDRPRYSEHSIESFDSVLDLAADIAIKRFAPHFKTADTQEPFVNPARDERGAVGGGRRRITGRRLRPRH